MQIVMAVTMKPEEYAQKYREIDCLLVERCPVCGARVRLQKHGWYARNAVPALGTAVVVMVRKLLCPICRRTVFCCLRFFFPNSSTLPHLW